MDQIHQSASSKSTVNRKKLFSLKTWKRKGANQALPNGKINTDLASFEFESRESLHKRRRRPMLLSILELSQAWQALFQSLEVSFSQKEKVHSMERRSSVSSGWSSPRSLQQSQWLRINLSELDKKTRAMLTLIEDDDDDDSIAKEVKKYSRKKPKLKQMVEEFSRAYRNLAEKYDQVWSGSEFSSSSSNSTEIHHVHKNVVSLDYSKWEAFNLHPESVVEDPDVKCGNTNLNFEPLGSDKMNDTSTDVNRKMDGFKLGGIAVGDFPACSLEQGDTWLELRFQVMKLMEENLQQQVELIRRNDENRETIKQLRYELELSKSENRALQSCLRCSKVDVKHNQSRISKLKGLILTKFFREGSA